MTHRPKLPAIDPQDAPLQSNDIQAFFPPGITYPVAGREKRQLGDALGLSQFGVNLVRLTPGAWSSFRHWHLQEDEFVYLLEGELTLITDGGRQTLKPGMAAGFPAGRADGHHMINEGSADAVYLEVGRRADSETSYYSDIDLIYSHGPWGQQFRHKNGEPY